MGPSLVDLASYLQHQPSVLPHLQQSSADLFPVLSSSAALLFVHLIQQVVAQEPIA